MRSSVYQINIHSQLRFLVALIGTFPLSVFFIKMILPKFESDIFIFLLILVAFIISFYLSYHLGLGKAKIVFDEEGLHHILEHRFIFSSEKNHLILNKMFYPKSSISWALLSLIGSFVFYYWIMKSKKNRTNLD